MTLCSLFKPAVSIFSHARRRESISPYGTSGYVDTHMRGDDGLALNSPLRRFFTRAQAGAVAWPGVRPRGAGLTALILAGWRFSQRRGAAIQHWNGSRGRFRQKPGRERKPRRRMRHPHHQIHEPHARQEAVRSGNGAKGRWLQIAYEGESQEDWHGGKL